jgi:hypothetical protein
MEYGRDRIAYLLQTAQAATPYRWIECGRLGRVGSGRLRGRYCEISVGARDLEGGGRCTVPTLIVTRLPCLLGSWTFDAVRY